MERDLSEEEGRRKEDTTPLPPGVYHIVVMAAEETNARVKDDGGGGQGMMKCRLHSLDHDYRLVCYHNFIVSGKGRGMGNHQLHLLGVPKEQVKIAPDDVIGKQGYVAVIEKEWDGKKRLEVDINNKRASIGFWSEKEPPTSSAIITKAVVVAGKGDEEIPF